MKKIIVIMAILAMVVPAWGADQLYSETYLQVVGGGEQADNPEWGILWELSADVRKQERWAAHLEHLKAVGYEPEIDVVVTEPVRVIRYDLMPNDELMDMLRNITEELSNRLLD